MTHEEPPEIFSRNIRLVIEYNGAGYMGWQAQAHGPSIQREVERVLTQLTGVRPSLRVAGRTDAGVHARGQVVSFKTNTKLPVERLAGGLNGLLPKVISVHQVDEVDMSFDAKRSSQWKRYRYTIYQARYPAAQAAPYAWHLIKTLDLAAMREAAGHFIGERDFESFRAVHCQAAHARREIFDISIDTEPRAPAGFFVHITYCADAFCRHMCRILTGTLVEVGRGERNPASMQDILAARSRKAAGITAPPHGLCLLEVGYSPRQKVASAS